MIFECLLAVFFTPPALHNRKRKAIKVPCVFQTNMTGDSGRTRLVIPEDRDR
jgi:hypothetical protein